MNPITHCVTFAAVATFFISSSLTPLAYAATNASGRDLHVDPTNGEDRNDGVSKPLKTISQAIKLAQPGDTIHLLPVIYHDYAGFYGKCGEPDKPITLDGHGAILEGSESLKPEQWRETSPGLFASTNLLARVDDAIIGRWFFLWNGKMNHMGRTSKGPSAKLKKAEELQAGEWTFLKDESRKLPNSQQIFGTFYVKLPPGQKLIDAKIRAPIRSAGVQFSSRGTNHNAHLIIRNLTATHVYNDGFNIHGHCEDVLFENIRAIECGDDGISAHETAQYRVDGFVSIGNSTGICDTGASETSYNHVFIRDCLGHDLYFLDTGRYAVSNSLVLSSASRAVVVTGRDNTNRPCSLVLDNVLIRRVTGSNEVRVMKNTTLDARHVTLLGLSFQATGGEVKLRDSVIAPAPEVTQPTPTYDYIAASAIPRGPLVPEIFLWRDVKWTASGNVYDVKLLRLDKTFYAPRTFADFQKQTGQDADSLWQSVEVREGVPRGLPRGIGADVTKLPQPTP